MHVSIKPFQNSVAVLYLCPPEVIFLAYARVGQQPPSLPASSTPMPIWVELPELQQADPLSYLSEARHWVETNKPEIEREIRRELISPVFLN